MSAEEFREYGYAVVDWVANYLAHADEFPVVSTVAPGDIAAMLSDTAPEHGEPFADLLSDLDDVVMPGITHWQSPNWFAYFPANTSGPSILAELASAGLGVQGMLWATSPAATEIESKVLDWLVDLMDLPQQWKSTGRGGGVIQMSASDSTHSMLVIARDRKKADSGIEDMVVYASNQAHSSVEKGTRVAGIGHVRLIDVDSNWAMDPDALRVAVEVDIAAGLHPIAVVSVVGTTGTTAVDPIGSIADIAAEFGLWHHVDAAYAGNAMVCSEFRHHIAGVDRVDSYTFNPHKWMMVNFDCNVLWVADRKPLIETLSILPAYLKNEATESGAVIDYRDWHVPLGRRFRALKLWWVIRSYGAEGLRMLIRHHVALASDLANRIGADDRFELFAPHPFGLVCFTHRDGNEATRSLAQALNNSGRVAVTPSELGGVTFIRLTIGQTRTEQAHVDALWDLMDDLS
ncbi:MAG: pyridoxal-dependent decarboxylase [Actinomycetota bacterium]|nr:pyridoxal-dependent decarboxylase [Actinomycetota bacterium]